MTEIEKLQSQLAEYKSANEGIAKEYDELLQNTNKFFADVKSTLAILAHIKPLLLMENVGIGEVMTLVNGPFLGEITDFTLDMMTKYEQFTPEEIEIIRKKGEKPQKEDTGMIKNLLSMFT
jgi:hypothetical protein